MSLVYNNDKPIGKCESYSIDKIHGTTPFVMLTNYEHLRSELTDDQQVVLDYLKSRHHDRAIPFDLVGGLNNRFFSSPDWETEKVLKAYGDLNKREQYQVLAAFAEWGMEQEEE